MGLNEGGYKKPVEKDPYELADDLVSNEIAWSGKNAYFTVLGQRDLILCWICGYFSICMAEWPCRAFAIL